MKIKPIEGAQAPSRQPIPAFSSGVSAGFPSPADDYIESTIDLNEHLIKRPAATFFARANGDSLMEIGIKDGDLLIIDRSVTPSQNDVVVVALNGDMTCKILDLRNKQLLAANRGYQPIAINDDLDVLIEGVVTHSIRYHHVRTG